MEYLAYAVLFYKKETFQLVMEFTYHSAYFELLSSVFVNFIFCDCEELCAYKPAEILIGFLCRI